MHALKRGTGSATSWRATRHVAHTGRRAPPTRPWHDGSVCANSFAVGRKTARARRPRPAVAARKARALLGMYLHVAEAPLEPLAREPQEMRGRRLGEGEREARLGSVGDERPHVWHRFELAGEPLPAGPVERRLEDERGGHRGVAAAQAQRDRGHSRRRPEVDLEARRLALEKGVPALDEGWGRIPAGQVLLEVGPAAPRRMR